ncbi:hypothetical protein CDAR_68141 [Caerostris darwini]|uniref:Secreted protein n=1 Tax=Caerostris darwini TaxID=1538125 RepID=A0AAV4VSB1_9ARAC|nr:hypothetical protein CDAR_68141 [Caerostris darwini]
MRQRQTTMASVSMVISTRGLAACSSSEGPKRLNHTCEWGRDRFEGPRHRRAAQPNCSLPSKVHSRTRIVSRWLVTGTPRRIKNIE